MPSTIQTLRVLGFGGGWALYILYTSFNKDINPHFFFDVPMLRFSLAVDNAAVDFSFALQKSEAFLEFG